MSLDVIPQNFPPFVDDMQVLLSDTVGAIWSRLKVEQWVRQSIANYSMYFPRIKRVEGELFVLPVFDFFRFVALEEGGVIDIVQVWYGDTQAPDPLPILLDRLPNYSFEEKHLHYSWFPQGQSIQTIGNLDTRGTIRLAFDPIPGFPEKVTAFCTTDHPAFDLQVGDQLTVPTSHYQLIRQWVVWQAWQERANKEAQTADPALNLDILDTYAENALREKETYDKMIENALANTLVGHSILTEWNSGVEYTRIY